MSSMSSAAVVLAISLVFFNFFKSTEAANHYTIILDRVQCNQNPEYIHNITCSIRAINKTTRAFTVDVFLKTNIVLRSIELKTSAFRKFGKNYVAFMGLKNVTVDICRAFSGSIQFLVLDMVIEDIKKYSNLFHPCPHTGNLYFKDSIINDSKFPPFAPPGEYYVHFMFYTRANGNEKCFLHYKLFGQVFPKSYSGK